MRIYIVEVGSRDCTSISLATVDIEKAIQEVKNSREYNDSFKSFFRLTAWENNRALYQLGCTDFGYEHLVEAKIMSVDKEFYV